MRLIRRAAPIVVAILSVSVIAAPQAASQPFFLSAGECEDVMILGIPGSNQGPAHSGNSDDFGPEVGDVVTSVRQSYGNEIRASALNYPAQLEVGLLGSNRRWADFATYLRSYRKGLANATAQLRLWAFQCRHAAFVLVGYSQGADIAGTLAEAIRKGRGAVPASRLIDTILIADPGFNPRSANALRFGDTAGGAGILGPRPRWPESFPHISVCIGRDIVCDYRSDDPAASSIEPHHEYTTQNWPAVNPETITDRLGRELGYRIYPRMAGGPFHY